MKKILIIALGVVCFGTTHAQNEQLTEAQWKAVEGVYQDRQDENLYLRFTRVEGGRLQESALWSGARLLLTPQSELVFGAPSEGKGPIRIVFHKDSVTGEVTQIRAFGMVWNKVKNYHPIERKEMTHTPEDLKPFEGIYRMKTGPNRYLYVQCRVKENQLVLKQHWDNREIAFIPDSALHFFTHEGVQFTLRFTRDPDGRVTEMNAFSQDHWTKMDKPGLRASDLAAYEGKYRSKDDPDNLLQLIVRGGDIVVRQVWDGKEIVLTPMTDTYFYNEAQSYPLQVIRGPDGKVTSILVFSLQEFDKVPNE